MHDVHGVAALPDADAARRGTGGRGRANAVVPAYFAAYERTPRPAGRCARCGWTGSATTTGCWSCRPGSAAGPRGRWSTPPAPGRSRTCRTTPASRPSAASSCTPCPIPAPTTSAAAACSSWAAAPPRSSSSASWPRVTETLWVTRREPVWRTDDFTPEAGRAAVALVAERVRRGLPPASVVSVTGLVLREQEREAERLGAYARRPMFAAIEPDGVRWADGGFEPVDVILWATGFRPAVRHLAPLRLRSEQGGIRLARDTTAVADPRVQLVGYGPSASTIGANRAGRAAARGVLRCLRAAAAQPLSSPPAAPRSPRGPAGPMAPPPRRCARSRTRRAPARPARRELGPRLPVEAELERVGAPAVGLPVHHEEAVAVASSAYTASIRPRTTCPPSTSANGASTATRHAAPRTGPASKGAISSARSLSSSMPRSPRPGRSSGSNRSCWPNRASTQAWKRVPNRAAGDGWPRHRPGQVTRRSASGSSRSRATAVADRLEGSGTSTSSERSRARLGQQPLELGVPLGDHARPRPRRAPGPRRRRRRAGSWPRAPRSAASSRRSASAVCSVTGQAAVVAPAAAGSACPSRASPPSGRALAPAAQRLHHRHLVRRGPERRLARRAPQVGRDPELVPGPGEGDVAEPELLLRLGVAGGGLERLEVGLVVAAQLGQVARRRRAAGRAAPRARGSTACGSGGRELLLAHADAGTRRPTPGPWPGGPSAASRSRPRSGWRCRGRCPSRPRR